MEGAFQLLGSIFVQNSIAYDGWCNGSIIPSQGICRFHKAKTSRPFNTDWEWSQDQFKYFWKQIKVMDVNDKWIA